MEAQQTKMFGHGLGMFASRNARLDMCINHINGKSFTLEMAIRSSFLTQTP